MIKCSICKNEKFKLKFHYLKKPNLETNFKINKKNYERFYIECKNCFHLFSLMSFSLENLYLKNYSKLTYGKKILQTFNKIKKLPSKKSDNYYRLKRFIKFFIEQKKIKSKYLDIGSGTGIFPYSLKENGINISCIEPDLNLRNHLKKNLSLRLIANDYNNKNLKSKYDVVSLNKVLEHVKSPKQFLGNISSVLRNKGFLYIEVPDAQLAAKKGKNREELFIEHLHGFSKKSLSILLKLNNFKILKIKSIIEPSGKFTLYGFAKKII